MGGREPGRQRGERGFGGRPSAPDGTGPARELSALYRVRKGQLAVVDVPELAYLTASGRGAPDGPEFAQAVQALSAVSGAALAVLRKERRRAPRMMPLEAQWWVQDEDLAAIIGHIGLGQVSLAEPGRDRWRWRAMIVQPDPIDARVIAHAIEQAQTQAGSGLPQLDRIGYERWAEGRCAQVLHAGPYATEGPSIVRLHNGIAAAGYQPRGVHHEIYLSDPRRVPPDRVRTILRQPIEPVAGDPTV